MEKYRIIIIDNPSQAIIGNSFAQKIFGQMCELKLKGYRSKHSGNSSILPLDTTDFFSIHALICRESTNGEYTPLMGYKVIPKSKCDQFGVDFPISTLIKNAGNDECYFHFLKKIQIANNEGADISYDTSWAVSPNGITKEVHHRIKNLLELAHYQIHLESNIKYWTTLGICKLKTDQYFMKVMGSEEVSDKPLISHPKLDGAQARALFGSVDHFPSSYKETVMNLHGYWENRIIITTEEAEQISIAA